MMQAWPQVLSDLSEMGPLQQKPLVAKNVAKRKTKRKDVQPSGPSRYDPSNPECCCTKKKNVFGRGKEGYEINETSKLGLSYNKFSPSLLV